METTSINDFLNNISTPATVADYSTIVLPSWAPPSYLFGPVRSILYLIIIISYTLFFHQWKNTKNASKRLLAPFVINIMSNALFTPLQFGGDWYTGAFIDIIIVLLSIIATIIVAYYLRTNTANKMPYTIVILLQLPYLARVAFATVLQYNVWLLN